MEMSRTPREERRHSHASLFRQRGELSKRGWLLIFTLILLITIFAYLIPFSNSSENHPASVIDQSSPDNSVKVRFSLDSTLSNKITPLDTLVETIKAFPGFEDFVTTACLSDVSEEFKVTSAARYEILRPQNKNDTRTYFFAMNLFNSQHIIPDLTYQLSHVAQHLGPKNVFISIFENGSTDQTKPMLRVLRLALSLLGVNHSITLSDIPPTSRDDPNRMERLAWTRQQAINPLYDLKEKRKRMFDYIVFMNDIFVCKDNILELIYQQRLQRSHMTCGLDFGDVERFPPDPRFYDTWVARDIVGTEFIREWESGVIQDKDSRDKMSHNEPFQAYCCWNGIVVLDTAPFYSHQLSFRTGRDNDTCSFASECTFVCEDFWGHGYGRIVIVPRVKVTYNRINFDALHRPGTRAEIGPRDRPFGDAENREIKWRKRPDKWFCSYERWMWVQGQGVGKGGRDPFTPSGEGL